MAAMNTTRHRNVEEWGIGAWGSGLDVAWGMGGA